MFLEIEEVDVGPHMELLGISGTRLNTKADSRYRVYSTLQGVIFIERVGSESEGAYMINGGVCAKLKPEPWKKMKLYHTSKNGRGQ